MAGGCSRTMARAPRAAVKSSLSGRRIGLRADGGRLLRAQRRGPRALAHDVVAGRLDQLLGARAIHGRHEGDRGRTRADEAPLASDEARVLEADRQDAGGDDGAALKAATRVGAAITADGKTGICLTLSNHERL